MVSYPQLWAASPGRWQAAAGAWRGLVGLVDRRAAEFPEQLAALHRAWAGGAAQAARTCLTGLRGRLTGTRSGWLEVDQALTWYATELARAKGALAATVAGAEPAGVTVDPDGRVGPAPGPVDPARAAAVGRIAAGIEAALRAAAGADAEVAQRLGTLAAAAVAGWPAVRPTGGGPAGGVPAGEPAAVRRWWDGLTDAQRRGWVTFDPATVGRLDGIPVADRDRANRLLLDGRREMLTAARARAVEAGRDAELSRLDGLLHGLDGLSARLAAVDEPRAYLVAMSVADDGRAVVAVGDPDCAENVLTYVPGMTASLADLDGELGRAESVAATAGRIDPAQRTAAVLWLDYDAPDFVGEATSAAQAHDAGPALHRFQEGLRASHSGEPAHQSVLGHSYGSLVVGETAARYGLAADSLVFVGSPGVGAASAGALGMPAGQVWSTTSASDVIQYAAVAPGALLSDLAVSAAAPAFAPAWAFGRPEDDLWHGPNPSRPEFGARVFTSQADAGHVGYWEPARPALDNLARITLGGAHQTEVR